MLQHKVQAVLKCYSTSTPGTPVCCNSMKLFAMEKAGQGEGKKISKGTRENNSDQWQGH